jgi:hypothetical protein
VCALPRNCRCFSSMLLLLMVLLPLLLLVVVLLLAVMVLLLLLLLLWQVLSICSKCFTALLYASCVNAVVSLHPDD